MNPTHDRAPDSIADPIGADPRFAPWPSLSSRGAAWLVAAWTAVVLAISVVAHTTPFYRVETDLVGEYLPAARELASGVLDMAHFAFKGPGYPLLVAMIAKLTNGDVALAARCLSPIAAGLAAWFAVLTRTNAVFLLPVALIALALRRPRRQGMAAYAVAGALPLAIWAFVARHAGGLPADRNYLNVAWELYGRGVPWDTFEATTGARFHSMWDVFAFDPLGAAAHVATNLVVQRVDDVHELVPVWLGVLAVPGVVLLARDRRSWLLLGHALACALVLATVFYGARFNLYLAPVLTGAAGATLLGLGVLGRRNVAANAPIARAAVQALAVAILLASTASGAAETWTQLAQAPCETRLAGEQLARMGLAGQSILARKPHVAWYSGMRFARLPNSLALRSLRPWAEQQRATYLFISPIEQVQLPALAVLADSGVTLPGFHTVAWRSIAPDHFYAVYRLDAGAVDSLAFARAYHAALLRYEARRPGSGKAALFVANQLLDLDAGAEALERLDRLRQAGARAWEIERMRTIALMQVGRLNEAASACRNAMSLEKPSGWHWSTLGEIAGRQHHAQDAREFYRRAVECETANLAFIESLGRVEVELGDYASAAVEFERCLRLAPGDVRLRRFAMGAWQLAGRPEQSRRLYADGLAAGIAPASLTDGVSR